MGRTLGLPELLGGYNVLDFNVSNDGTHDAGAQINAAFNKIVNYRQPAGTLYFPSGTYNIITPVSQPSNTVADGFGPTTLIQLGADRNVDVWRADGVSNIRIRNMRLDGNRSNNASGTRNGLWLQNVVDAWIENVECISARGDGFWLDGCERVELVGCKASDNGRHGIALSNCVFCQLVSPRCYDNCQVATSGAGDGIRLELLSGDNTIVCPVCYETALAGDNQGYGIREADAEGCYRNNVLGGVLRGNKTGAASLESRDSVHFDAAAVRYLSANLTNPT